MPKSENQKLKIFYISEFFKERTDEGHPVYVKDIKEYLAELDIEAEEHSISRDIRFLKDTLGMDIVGGGGTGRPYYLQTPEWDNEELLEMAIGVSSSKYLTKKKAESLVNKISSLANDYQKDSIPKRVFAVDRVRNENEQILTNIRIISKAITDKKKICFSYTTHKISDNNNIFEVKKKIVASPLELYYNEGIYYLFLFAYDKIYTYRLDRMKEVELLNECIEGEDVFHKYDVKSYPKRAFNMFGKPSRESITVEMVCDNKLLSSMIDRFGKSGGVRYFKEDDKHFRILASVYESDMFYSWLCQYGDKIQVLTPEIAKRYNEFLLKITNKYL